MALLSRPFEMAAIKAAGASPGGKLAFRLGEQTGQPFDVGAEHVAFQEDLDQLPFAQIHKLVHLDTRPPPRPAGMRALPHLVAAFPWRKDPAAEALPPLKLAGRHRPRAGPEQLALVAQRPCRHLLAGKGEELGRQIGDALTLAI